MAERILSRRASERRGTGDGYDGSADKGSDFEARHVRSGC
jgi:hypothetical protein